MATPYEILEAIYRMNAVGTNRGSDVERRLILAESGITQKEVDGFIQSSAEWNKKNPRDRHDTGRGSNRPIVDTGDMANERYLQSLAAASKKTQEAPKPSAGATSPIASKGVIRPVVDIREPLPNIQKPRDNFLESPFGLSPSGGAADAIRNQSLGGANIRGGNTLPNTPSVGGGDLRTEGGFNNLNALYNNISPRGAHVSKSPGGESISTRPNIERGMAADVLNEMWSNGLTPVVGSGKAGAISITGDQARQRMADRAMGREKLISSAGAAGARANYEAAKASASSRNEAVSEMRKGLSKNNVKRSISKKERMLNAKNAADVEVARINSEGKKSEDPDGFNKQYETLSMAAKFAPKSVSPALDQAAKSAEADAKGNAEVASSLIMDQWSAYTDARSNNEQDWKPRLSKATVSAVLNHPSRGKEIRSNIRNKQMEYISEYANNPNAQPFDLDAYISGMASILKIADSK